MFERVISKIVTILIIVFLSFMVCLAFLQIILRNFFASGISWADVTVRHLVLWVGFFGAILAAVEERHITLDVFSRILPVRLKKYVQSTIYIGSAAVCAVLTHASYKFVVSERLVGTELFTGVPAWWAQVVVPATFVIMCLLFILRGIKKWLQS